MVNRRGILLLPILILILSGCFRQASDPIEPVNESLSDVSGQQVMPTQTQASTDTDGMITDTPANNTDMPMPTSEEQPTDSDATDADTDSPQIQVTASTPVPLATSTLAATNTLQPTVDTGTGGGAVGPVSLATETPEFITPQAGGSGAITTPTPLPTQPIDPTPTEPAQPEAGVDVDDSCLYVVQRGDNLYRIAVNNNTTIDDLVAINPGLNPNLIFEGDEIILPDCDPDETAAEEPEDPADEETTSDDEADSDDEGDTTVVGTPGELVHVVASGETLSTIAQRYDVTIASIIEANQLADPNRLSVGQELVIPQ